MVALSKHEAVRIAGRGVALWSSLLIGTNSNGCAGVVGGRANVFRCLGRFGTVLYVCQFRVIDGPGQMAPRWYRKPFVSTINYL